MEILKKETMKIMTTECLESKDLCYILHITVTSMKLKLGESGN